MESTYNDDNAGARDAIRGARGAATHDLKALLSDVQDLLERVTQVADPEVARLRERIGDRVSAARQAVTQRARQVGEQAGQALRTGDDYVRDRPWQAIGVAAVAGLLAGVLFSRR